MNGIGDERLAVVGAITEVSSAVGSLISSYKGNRMINRMQLKYAQDKLRACIAMQRTRIVGEVGRSNLLELKKTMDMLDSMNLKGPMADYAMRTVESMAAGLEQILEDLKNEYRQPL